MKVTGVFVWLGFGLALVVGAGLGRYVLPSDAVTTKVGSGDLPDTPPSRISTTQALRLGIPRSVSRKELAVLMLSPEPPPPEWAARRRERLLHISQIAMHSDDEAAALAHDIAATFELYDEGMYASWLKRLETAGVKRRTPHTPTPPQAASKWENDAKSFAACRVHWDSASLQVTRKGAMGQWPAASGFAVRMYLFNFGPNIDSPPPAQMDTVTLTFYLVWTPEGSNNPTMTKVGMEFSRWPEVNQWLPTRSFLAADEEPPGPQVPLPPL